MWDLKPMILARKQAGQPISPSLEEEFNNLPQSLQQAWDEAATFPSYHKIVESEEDEEEETEEKVKEVEDVPFEEPLLYKELKPYVPPITLPSQPKQENVVTFPLKGEEVEKEDTEEKVKEAEDVPFEAPLIYKEPKPYVYPITLLSQPKQEDVVTFPLKGEEVEKEEMEEQGKEAEDVPFEESLIYKELKPYVPPITFPSRLHKSNWNKWFSELISPHFIVNIYLPLLIVCRNMPIREKFFQDLIAYRRKFETLEFG
ncbi:hypothetical protein QYF36_014407 [Acer negundo]|nr:hypothetical protein QYF36_014407 [Acer negundo]